MGLALMAGCSKDAPLPGERIPVRPPSAAVADGPRAIPISLPAATFNADWSHRNGAAQGRPSHPAIAPVPQLRWATGIGDGDAKRRRILAGPVVAGGLIFAMDASGRISAVSRGGQVVWSQSLVPTEQTADAGPGGGMAVAGGVLYVTTGFGDVLAMAPSTGNILWRKTLEAPVRAAPTVHDGKVIVVLRNDFAYALNATNGEVEWGVQGIGGTGLLGGSSAAADGQLVVVPFASGEVLGVLSRSGLQLWGTAVTGGRRNLARNQINDISGDPIIAGDAVFASNQSGRTIRLDRDSGERLWTMPEGAYGPAWPVGGSIFLLSDVGSLVRASAATGEILWEIQLPEFLPVRRTPLSWLGKGGPPSEAVTYYGPILAGGRLWVASGDGFLRAFSPSDGSLLAEIALPGGAAAQPAVAGGVMYVVSRDGQLLAFQ
jgi:outer membrane protein assembly factor BamB